MALPQTQSTKLVVILCLGLLCNSAFGDGRLSDGRYLTSQYGKYRNLVDADLNSLSVVEGDSWSDQEALSTNADSDDETDVFSDMRSQMQELQDSFKSAETDAHAASVSAKRFVRRSYSLSDLAVELQNKTAQILAGARPLRNATALVQGTVGKPRMGDEGSRASLLQASSDRDVQNESKAVSAASASVNGSANASDTTNANASADASANASSNASAHAILNTSAVGSAARHVIDDVHHDNATDDTHNDNTTALPLAIGSSMRGRSKQQNSP